MPGSKASMAVQKKHIPPSQGPLSTRTIESQRKRNASEKAGDNGGYLKPNSQAKKTACSVNNAAEICNTASPRPNTVSNGLNVDERLKAARERREEHHRLLASRENGRMEREQRARRYYELQIQERRKKLLDQRLKEERKRAAVEEKRKQRLKEDKERYESAVRRTVEKSQRAQQSHNSRGRKPTKNLPRRLPLTPWEKNLVIRLLTPTCSYLARSKSAQCQSGEAVVHICRRAVSFHSMNSTTTSTPHKPQQLHHKPSVSPNYSQHRSSNLAEIEASSKKDTKKKNSNTKSPAVSTSVKPAKVTLSRTTSPSPERSSRRSMSRHSPPLQLELPSVPEEDVSVSDSVSECVSVLSPGNSRPVRKTSEGQERGGNPPEAPRLNLPDKETPRQRSPPQKPLPADPQPPEVTCRPSAGTTDAGQASRLLAERRREARQQREREERQQREREEQEHLQREEAERRSREDLDLRRAEQRERQQAEDQRLVEEKKRREEEEQKRAEEERAQAMKEAVLLQKQREEEQAKERAKAEQLKQEREIIAQKEEAARQVRKKRLEEIMRRTRRSDSPDTKSVPARILPDEARPKENTEPVLRGSIEAAVKLPVGTKSSGLNNEEDGVPVVAFKERRSLRTLSGLEEIQTHQRAEVI
ncbi:ensconsin-like isoform X1 [Pseudochaenichthys georgianus]|uniref:ensconsin-like isoform X1 n=1 Tax=Pseudochaenichthys georgianus TaxID=52239 RepID=UPI00146BD2DF|nr:ensconsin-like isoform X1 [Pseudochaenichthys georgianus]XP_033935797.1 ensconsin-like isoform X1 [Pseudochaenichthys georgianus]